LTLAEAKTTVNDDIMAATISADVPPAELLLADSPAVVRGPDGGAEVEVAEAPAVAQPIGHVDFANEQEEVAEVATPRAAATEDEGGAGDAAVEVVTRAAAEAAAAAAAVGAAGAEHATAARADWGRGAFASPESRASVVAALRAALAALTSGADNTSPDAGSRNRGPVPIADTAAAVLSVRAGLATLLAAEGPPRAALGAPLVGALLHIH
jgi:hypothetical protein